MIAVWNLEPRYTNIALEKIKMYFEKRNEAVTDYLPLEHHLYKHIFCSSLFTFTDKRQIPDDIIRGGSGFNLTTMLPKEIDIMKPKINIGFTTRGCIRKCSFCIVPEKEGLIRITGDLYDLWDGKSKDITLFDNNILAKPNHFESICKQAQRENIRLDFNQGLDYRLLNKHIIDVLKDTRHLEYRFSYDQINDKEEIIRAIKLLKQYGINKSMWFVLVGYDTNKEEDMERLILLKNLGQDAYVQRYNKITNPYYIRLSQWVNQHHIFPKYTFEEFCKIKDGSSCQNVTIGLN